MSREKSERINCRVTSEEKNLLIDLADKTGMDVSKYIRAMLFRKTVSGVTQEDLDDLKNNLIYQVRKIGVNINQIAKAANSMYFDDRDRSELFLEQERLTNLMKKCLEKLEELKENASWQ